MISRFWGSIFNTNFSSFIDLITTMFNDIETVSFLPGSSGSSSMDFVNCSVGKSFNGSFGRIFELGFCDSVISSFWTEFKFWNTCVWIIDRRLLGFARLVPFYLTCQSSFYANEFLDRLNQFIKRPCVYVSAFLIHHWFFFQVRILTLQTKKFVR